MHLPRVYSRHGISTYVMYSMNLLILHYTHLTYRVLSKNFSINFKILSLSYSNFPPILKQEMDRFAPFLVSKHKQYLELISPSSNLSYPCSNSSTIT